MGYVTLSALKRTLELPSETYADDDLRTAITSASAAVEAACGRRFTLDGDDVQRVYEPRREGWLEFDDLTELTSIDYDRDGTDEWVAWTTDDYELLPYNAAADSEPYTELQFRPHTELWFEPVTRVRITGKFGWPAVPAAIQEATALIAARLLKRVREAPFGIAGIGGDGIAVRISSHDPDVRMLLSPYVRPVHLA